MSTSKRRIPASPRVISPTPPSESAEDSAQKEYFGPITRSASKKKIGSPSPATISENHDEASSDESFELQRARTRSRSPMLEGRRRMSGLAAVNPKSGIPSAALTPAKKTQNGDVSNGHLSPMSAVGSSYWRAISRSPSPLGLIPVHRQFRYLIHKHEIPRKGLHVSIGFLTIYLYVKGVQSYTLPPYLMGALIPIAFLDYIRHRYPEFNRLYIRVCGVLMRESEVKDKWNGVIWYLLGVWVVLRFFSKDVGVMGVLLLSWCDTAASTIGRLYGKYTPRIRKGKSLAGSAAAWAVGVLTALFFWGWLAPRIGPFPDDPKDAFMFTGTLSLPASVKGLLGWSESQGNIHGALALAVMSIWAGFVAAASEAVDLFGWDDNLTIPILSGLGLWGFLKIFT